MANADALRALLETIHLFADNGSVWPAGSTQTRSELRTLAREALALLPSPAPETPRAALVALVGFWNARADGYRGSSFAAAVYRECVRDLEAALAQPGAAPQAQPTCEWLTMDSAPHDRMIVVYAPGREGLPDMFSWCRWHPDAGFCIDELREPTRWHAGPTWGMVSPGEPAAPAPTERSAE